MAECQVSPRPPGEAGFAWGPRAAGVWGEESLPASVLCAARRGCGQPRPVRPRVPPTAARRGGGPRQPRREDPAAHWDRC